MPSYEYECISCSMRFTVERSIHEDNAPYCCGFAMRQVYGVPGISFKGKGWGGQWHAQDYAYIYIILTWGCIVDTHKRKGLYPLLESPNHYPL